MGPNPQFPEFKRSFPFCPFTQLGDTGIEYFMWSLELF